MKASWHSKRPPSIIQEERYTAYSPCLDWDPIQLKDGERTREESDFNFPPPMAPRKREKSRTWKCFLLNHGSWLSTHPLFLFFVTRQKFFWKPLRSLMTIGIFLLSYCVCCRFSEWPSSLKMTTSLLSKLFFFLRFHIEFGKPEGHWHSLPQLASRPAVWNHAKQFNLPSDDFLIKRFRLREFGLFYRYPMLKMLNHVDNILALNESESAFQPIRGEKKNDV